jgi:hypothetical protein
VHVMRKEIKNLPASVHARLKNLAREKGRTFQELFYYYAIERFLYRLSCSQYADSFILKGALMFAGWGIPLRRSTRDIDVQGHVDHSVENLVGVVKRICVQDVEPDGMWFDPDSVRGEQIMTELEYQGVRVYFDGYLGRASVQLHLDVSFANVITPSEIQISYPSLLSAPTFEMRGYPYETAIAEKFQSMVALGSINDRMKDFFDIWLLSREVRVDGSTLGQAIRATFQNRNTLLPRNMPTALTTEFAQLRQPDWHRFLEHSRLDPSEYPVFDEIVTVIREFLWPVVQASIENSPFEVLWEPGGPWKEM